MKAGDLVALKNDWSYRPAGKGIILDIDLGATGFTVRVFFPKLLGDNFDGIKYCQQKSLEVISESR